MDTRLGLVVVQYSKVVVPKHNRNRPRRFAHILISGPSSSSSATGVHTNLSHLRGAEPPPKRFY